MTRKIMLILLASFFSLALLFACGDENMGEKQEPDVTYKDVAKETKEAMETAKDYTQRKKEEYLRQMNARLEEFDKEMQALQAKAESKTAELKEESKAKFNQTMETLNQKKQAAAEKLEELKSASGKAWENIKSGVNSSMDELGKAFEKASSQFTS